MNLFAYTGPMTSADIFADVYRRSARSLSCRDRMCGAEDCETCRGPQEEVETEQEQEPEQQEEQQQ
jgi:hypothetical protein